MFLLHLVMLINTAFATTLLTNKLDRYIIACHTTDFKCFQKQYMALRDNVLSGNTYFGIPQHKPFAFKYGDTETCVQLTGLERSELVGISFDSNNREYSVKLQLPLRINQIRRYSDTSCAEPDREFVNTIPQQEGPYMRLTGNATIQVTYPYRLKKEKGDVHLDLQDEDVDMILDIPDLSHFDTASEVESRLYQWSEWAYDAVQHVYAAQRFAIPYTSKMKYLMDKVPLKMLILLYPDESYTDLQFIFTDTLQSR